MEAAFITGASGVVGRAVLQLLIARGWSVRALEHRTPLREVPTGVDRVSGDILEFRDEWLVDVTAVIHLAAETQTRRGTAAICRTNTEGTRRVVDAVTRRSTRPRLVFTSSIAAMGPSRSGRPLVATDPPSPVSTYGRSKLDAERIVASASGAAIVRLPMVVAEHDRLRAKLAPLLGLGLFPTGPARFGAIDVRDAASLLEVLARRGATGGTLLASDGRDYGWDDVRVSLSRKFGRPLRGLPIPTALLHPALFARLGAAEVASYFRDDWRCAPTSVAGHVPQFAAWP